MQAIYEPKGAAREYAELAVNLYGNAQGKKSGCPHKCLYCYCPQYSYQKPDEFFCSPKPRIGILDALERDADRMSHDGDTRRVLFSFFGDCYCPEEEDYELTRQALRIMVDRGLRFEVCTKGGILAERDFDLLLLGGGRLGTSLVWGNEEHLREWEPNAASLVSRTGAMQCAMTRGIYNWVSVEPVIDPREAIEAINGSCMCRADEFRVGRINHIHMLPDELRKQVENVDWQAFTDECYELLLQSGKRFMFKQSLHPYLNGKPARVGYE